MSESTTSDLSSLMMDLHFERESVDSTDPSAVADVIRSQLYQLNVARSVRGDEGANAADSYLEFEDLRLSAEYSEVVDNHDGSTASETNLNNFAGLVIDDQSGRSQVKRWRSSAFDAVRGKFRDEKARKRWSFLDEFVKKCERSTVKLDLGMEGITESRAGNFVDGKSPGKENKEVRKDMESPFQAPSLLREGEDPLKSRENDSTKDTKDSRTSSLSEAPVAQPAKRKRELTPPKTVSTNSFADKPWKSSEPLGRHGGGRGNRDGVPAPSTSVGTESSNSFNRNNGERWKMKKNDSRWNRKKKGGDDENNDNDERDICRNDAEFRTARQQLVINNVKQNKRDGYNGGGNSNANSGVSTLYGNSKKSLGGKGAGVYARFKPPVRNEDENGLDVLGGRNFNDDAGRNDDFSEGRGGGRGGYDDRGSAQWNSNCGTGSNSREDPLHKIASRVLRGGGGDGGGRGGGGTLNDNPRSSDSLVGENGEPVDELLRGLDPKLIESIENEIVDRGKPVEWDDIAGLAFAKKTLNEVVVWPMLRPDIFTGLRAPPKGLLLFGPPGTGKTMIGKCIACKSKSTFFSISASSLTSKWIGEGEKLVRTLFAVARVRQPSVIFIDEIDSLLSQRTESEHEASRRMKTQFLIELDGATSAAGDERLLIIGATNRPQELDEAARRRLVKRLWIPLPDVAARRCIVANLLQSPNHALSDADLDSIAERTHNYSGSDMAHLCRDASMGPIRELTDIMNIETADVRPIEIKDFVDSLSQVRASVSEKELLGYREWNKLYGSFDSSK